MTFAVSLIIRTDAEYLVIWGLLDSLFHSMCSMEKGDSPKQSKTFFKYLSQRGFGFWWYDYGDILGDYLPNIRKKSPAKVNSIFGTILFSLTKTHNFFFFFFLCHLKQWPGKSHRMGGWGCSVPAISSRIWVVVEQNNSLEGFSEETSWALDISLVKLFSST